MEKWITAPAPLVATARCCGHPVWNCWTPVRAPTCGRAGYPQITPTCAQFIHRTNRVLEMRAGRAAGAPAPALGGARVGAAHRDELVDSAVGAVQRFRPGAAGRAGRGGAPHHHGGVAPHGALGPRGCARRPHNRPTPCRGKMCGSLMRARDARTRGPRILGAAPRCSRHRWRGQWRLPGGHAAMF